MGIFRSDLKRIFTSWIFFLSIVIVVIGGIIQCLILQIIVKHMGR